MPAQSLQLPAHCRTSRRISITIPYNVAISLQDRCDQEGRSLSNLAAYLLESSLSEAC